MFPSNERETIELYKVFQGLIGWQITHLQTGFPDAIISNNGRSLIVEFEYKARNFRSHKHDPDVCDIIICWENNWEDAPLPVFALEDCVKDGCQEIQSILVPYEKALSKTEKKIRRLEKELQEEKATNVYDWFEEDFEYFLLDCYQEIMADLALEKLEKRHGLKTGALVSKYGSKTTTPDGIKDDTIALLKRYRNELFRLQQESNSKDPMYYLAGFSILLSLGAFFYLMFIGG